MFVLLAGVETLTDLVAKLLLHVRQNTLAVVQNVHDTRVSRQVLFVFHVRLWVWSRGGRSGNTTFNDSFGIGH